jgi:cytochrome c oxidase subunit 1
MAYYDYSNAAHLPMALSVSISVVGAFILVISAILFFVVLLEGQRAPRENVAPYRFSMAVHPPVTLPAVLNSHALWMTLMVGVTITNYGFSVFNLVTRSGRPVPAIYVGGER